MEAVNIQNLNEEDVQDLGAFDEIPSEIVIDYFETSETNDFEIISKNIPKVEYTQLSLLNRFYDTLSSAAKIPEFSETANGIINLFVNKSVTRYTYENIMIAIASAISLNPSFAWWILINGGMVSNHIFVLMLEFIIMNPTKVVALYGLSQKIPSMIKLYNIIFGEKLKNPDSDRMV